VSKQVVNESGQAAVKRSVPLPMVSGVKATAYPQNQRFAGGSAPEPESLLSLTLVALLGGMFLRRRRRA